MPINAAFHGADHTDEFNREDIEKNKLLSLLSYLWVLILFPVFEAKDSLFIRFHRRQGLALLITETVYTVTVFINLGVSGMYLSGIPLFLVGIINYAGYLLFLYLTVKGISNVLRGKAEELPLIGRIAEAAGKKING